VQKIELNEKKWSADDSEQENFLCGQQFPPFVGLGDPPLRIANQSFVLNDTDREENPENDHERDEAASGNFLPGDMIGTYLFIVIRRMSHELGVQAQERDRNNNLWPVPPGVLFENIQDLLHGAPLGLVAFSRHG
jgi:hypothetical protein